MQYCVTNECWGMQLGMIPCLTNKCSFKRHFSVLVDKKWTRFAGLWSIHVGLSWSLVNWLLKGCFVADTLRCLQWANPQGQCDIYTWDLTEHKGNRSREIFLDISLQLLCNLAWEAAAKPLPGLYCWQLEDRCIYGAARAINNYITIRGYPGINWKLVLMPKWDPDNLQTGCWFWVKEVKGRVCAGKTRSHQNTVEGRWMLFKMFD